MRVEQLPGDPQPPEVLALAKYRARCVASLDVAQHRGPVPFVPLVLIDACRELLLCVCQLGAQLSLTVYEVLETKEEISSLPIRAGLSRAWSSISEVSVSRFPRLVTYARQRPVPP